MPDDQSGGHEHEAPIDHTPAADSGALDQQGAGVAGATGGQPARPLPRRPRPAPSSAYTSTRRTRREAPSRLNPFIVPAFAAIALLALLGAVAFDHFHNVTASPAATPTLAPIPTVPTPAPSPTAVKLPLPSTSKPGVAAEVNGEVISMNLFGTLATVDVAAIQRPGQNPATGAPVPGQDLTTAAGKAALRLREKTDLDGLISTALAVSYARKHGLLASQSQIDSQLNGIYTQQGGKAAFLKAVETQGYTEPVVKEIVANQATGGNVNFVIGTMAPCPCAGKHVRHILVKDKALAQKLAKELQANGGATFAALAAKYSTDTGSAIHGGDLGGVIKGQTVAPFEKAVFSQKVGQISSPVQSQFGYHIIEVLPGSPPTTQSSGTYFAKWLKDQRAKAAIKTYVKI